MSRLDVPSFAYSSLLSLPLLAIRIDVHDQPFSRSDLVALVDAIPDLELGHRYLELMRDAEHRVAAAYGIQHAATAHHALVAIMPRAGLDDQPLALHQRIAGPQVVQ